MNITRTAFIASALNLGLLFSPCIRAEGTLRGRVIDDRGRQLSGVKVELDGSQGKRNVHTDQQGNYWFYGLTPGTYKATYSIDGFTTGIRKGLSIKSVNETIFNWTMCGTGYDCYRVIRTVPAIDTTSSFTSLYIDRDMLEKFYR